VRHQTNYTDIDYETFDRLSISLTVICPKKIPWYSGKQLTKLQ